MGLKEQDSVKISLENSKAEYKQLGKCGLKISVPILGAMTLGDTSWLPWLLDEEKSLPLLKAAYDRGLNTWDTANIYSNGVSETIIGKAIKKYDIPRHKLVILTKCFFTTGEEPWTHGEPEMAASKDYVNHGGLSRQAIFQACDASLQRLGIDYIDIYQIHRFDNDTPIEETMEALHDLVRMGKVRYIGASSMWAFQFAMMQSCAEKNGWTKFVSMQNHYNLLYREEEREMIKYCNATGVGLIPWAPLCRGILARPPVEAKAGTARAEGDDSETGYSEVDKRIVGRVQELADKKGWKVSP